jgi:hypothetical protein
MPEDNDLLGSVSIPPDEETPAEAPEETPEATPEEPPAAEPPAETPAEPEPTPTPEPETPVAQPQPQQVQQPDPRQAAIDAYQQAKAELAALAEKADTLDPLDNAKEIAQLSKAQAKLSLALADKTEALEAFNQQQQAQSAADRYWQSEFAQQFPGVSVADGKTAYQEEWQAASREYADPRDAHIAASTAWKLRMKQQAATPAPPPVAAKPKPAAPRPSGGTTLVPKGAAASTRPPVNRDALDEFASKHKDFEDFV